jgi:Fe-S-cluster containining protein
MELDKINYYLNFRSIEICLSADGEWTVYYNYPCRFFDTKKSLCTLHATPQKPGICVNYNPYYCFYKKIAKTRHHSNLGTLWINRERMDFLKSHVYFDEDRRVLEIPEKEKLFEELSRIPYEIPNLVAAPDEDQAIMERKQFISSETNPAGEGVLKSHLDLREPCKGCDSYCCQSLVFPQEKPSTYSSLDYLRYALGFPGLELGISDSRWYIIVKTTCLHLDSGRCSIHEKPGRPLICKYYNPMNCFHKSHLVEPGLNGFIRVGYEEFNWLLETYKFDDIGGIIESYDCRSFRAHIESKWQQGVDKGRPESPAPPVPSIPTGLSLEKIVATKAAGV